MNKAHLSHIMVVNNQLFTCMHLTIGHRSLPQYHREYLSRDGGPIFLIYCIITVPSSWILRYLWLSEFEELFYFFLIVGSNLLRQSCLCTDDQVISSHKSETLRWSKSTIFILLVILWAFSQMCTVETLQPSALCVFIRSLRLLSSSGHHPFS